MMDSKEKHVDRKTSDPDKFRDKTPTLSDTMGRYPKNNCKTRLSWLEIYESSLPMEWVDLKKSTEQITQTISKIFSKHGSMLKSNERESLLEMIHGSVDLTELMKVLQQDFLASGFALGNTYIPVGLMWKLGGWGYFDAVNQILGSCFESGRRLLDRHVYLAVIGVYSRRGGCAQGELNRLFQQALQFKVPVSSNRDYKAFLYQKMIENAFLSSQFALVESLFQQAKASHAVSHKTYQTMIDGILKSKQTEQHLSVQKFFSEAKREKMANPLVCAWMGDDHLEKKQLDASIKAYHLAIHLSRGKYKPHPELPTVKRKLIQVIACKADTLLKYQCIREAKACYQKAIAAIKGFAHNSRAGYSNLMDLASHCERKISSLSQLTSDPTSQNRATEQLTFFRQYHEVSGNVLMKKRLSQTISSMIEKTDIAPSRKIEAIDRTVSDSVELICHLDFSGSTPLHTAIVSANLQVLDNLLAKLQKANKLDLIHSTDADGYSPLARAIQSANESIVAKLIEHGASYRAIDSHGASPLSDIWMYMEPEDAKKMLAFLKGLKAYDASKDFSEECTDYFSDLSRSDHMLLP